jgi:hypothetical protein
VDRRLDRRGQHVSNRVDRRQQRRTGK